MKISTQKSEKGSILLAIVLMLPFLMLIMALYMDLTISSFRVARRDQSHTYAQLAVDAGADYALDQVNADADWTGTGGQVELQNDGNFRTTYEVTLSSVDDDHKNITSIGRAFRPADSSEPEATITVQVGVRAVRSGEYSVVSGVGGLIMGNGSKIMGGDVFINGTISLSNYSQIGLTTSPVGVEVAHDVCPNPADATYPRICNSGENGQPITISGNARIYGEVKANNQTSGAGMTNPGLTASSGVATRALPSHNRSAQKAAITTTITAASASCNNGTKTWAANTKITGNVTVSGTCKVTVEGNVWITGTFTMNNSSDLIVSEGLGTTRPVIMIDGTSATFNQNSELISNSSNTGFMIINYVSDASCSPDCADVTGTDLYNSRGDERVSLRNSSSGPNTIFYARWGKVQVNNSGQIGALVGQTVEISNNGTITFGTSTGEGTAFWVISTYRRVS